MSYPRNLSQHNYPWSSSATPKRRSQLNAGPSRRITWSVCIGQKRYVRCSYTQINHLSFLSQVARAKLVQDEFIRKAQASAKEGQKAADVLADGAIVGLGLIQRSREQAEEKK